MAARRTLTIAFALLLATAGMAAQQNSPARSEHPQRPAPAHKPPSGPCTCVVTEEQARAFQSDLQRMRTLIPQMQMNLVSLPPGPTPLRHQFELEIEMWQVLLDNLSRNLQAANPPAPQALPER